MLMLGPPISLPQLVLCEDLEDEDKEEEEGIPEHEFEIPEDEDEEEEEGIPEHKTWPGRYQSLPLH